MKNLTPEHMRCFGAAGCPSIHQLEDGRLLIVGDAAGATAIASAAGIPVARGERAIVIDRALLADVPQ
jgi:hypothetical protein